MAGSRERSRDPAIVFSRTRPGRSRMIVLTFPPVGQLSSFPPHSVNIFPTTRPHVSGQCPAPRSGVRNVHHTSVLFPGRVRPGLRPVGAHTPAGYTDESPRGSTAESDSRWQFPITVAFSILGALSPSQRECGACWLITTPPLADDMATPAPSCHRVAPCATSMISPVAVTGPDDLASRRVGPPTCDLPNPSTTSV